MNEGSQNIKDDQANDTKTQKLSKFLEVNEWKIEKLQQWPEWEQIDDVQKQELGRVCQLELMMKEAIEWVKEEKNRSINDILKQEKFAQLKKYKKFKRWLSNKKNKSNESNNESSMNNKSKVCYSLCGDKFIQMNAVEEPLASLNTIMIENSDNGLIQKALLDWENLVLRCENLSYLERCQALRDKYHHDPSVFVELLKQLNKEKYFSNIFSCLLNVVLQLKEGHDKTDLFIVTCTLFNNELLLPQHKDNLIQGTIQSSLNKLQYEASTQEVIGIMKILFVNNFTLNKPEYQHLTKIIQDSSLTWRCFLQFIQGPPFFVRNEVAERLPSEGRIFKNCIIQIMKTQGASLFIKVPNEYRKQIIDISIYCTDNQIEQIQIFVEKISDIIQCYFKQLKNAQLNVFLDSLLKELKAS